MNIKQIISNAIDEVSYKTSDGMVNLHDTYHLYMVQEELKKHIDPDVVNLILEKDKEKKSAKEQDPEKYKSIGGSGYVLVSDLKDDWKLGDDDVPDGIQKFTKDDSGKFVPQDEKEDPEAGEDKEEMDYTPSDEKEEEEAAVHNKDYDPDNVGIETSKRSRNSLADKLEAVVTQIPFEEPKDEEKAAFQRVIDASRNGENPSDEDWAVFNKYARVKETSGMKNPEFAIYICNTTPGDFNQGRRIKIEMGGGKDAHGVRKKMEAQGAKAASASTTSGKYPPKLAGKAITMTKTAKSKHGGGVKEHKVTRKPKTGGPVQEVRFGNRVLKRIPEPDEDKLIAEVLDRFVEIMKGPPKVSKKVAKRAAQKKIKTIRRNNKNIDQYENIDVVEEARLVKFDPEDQDSSTPEGRAKVAKEGPKNLAAMMREEMEKHGPLTEAEEEMLKRLEDLGDIEDAKEYEKAAMQLLADMQKVESMRKGVPDIAEAVIMCVMNKKGLDCIAPAGETYKVSDLIVYPPPDNPEDPNSAEYIVWLESTGGLSVKWKGGAASGARAKIEVTEFLNEETQERCTTLLDLHNNFMGTSKQPLTAKRIEDGKAELDKQEKWAREQGLLNDDDFDENGDLILPGSKNNRTTKQWANDSVADWQEKGSLPPDCTPTLAAVRPEIPCLTEENKKLLIDGLEQYCRGGIMLSHIHNRDLDFQPYGNANGTADSLELSNGIDCVNHMHFQPNPGFKFTIDDNGNHIVRPNAVYAGHLEKVCD